MLMTGGDPRDRKRDSASTRDRSNSGGGSSLGAAENSFCASTTLLRPHLAVRSCFGLSMVQLSTAPNLSDEQQ